MLPADSARRLVSLFTQALDDCTAQQQKLQQNLMRCQAVLKDWNSEASESATLEESKNDNEACVDSEPSAKQLEELELLNKALEKALKIRKKFQQAPCELTESTKAADKTVVISAPLNQQGNSSKESNTRTGKVSSVIRRPTSFKKPTAYMLKAPYRTDPDVKRPHVKTSTRLTSITSKMPEKKRSSKGTASLKAKLPVKVSQSGHEKASVAKKPGKNLHPPGLPHCAKQSPSFGISEGEGDSADSPLPETEPDLSDPAVARSATQTDGRKASLGTGIACQVSTLQEKGSLLELPLPYKKAFSKYIRLLEKCRGCQTNPEAAAAKNRFMENLQGTSSKLAVEGDKANRTADLQEVPLAPGCSTGKDPHHSALFSSAYSQFCSPSPVFSLAEVRRELVHLNGVCSLIRQYMETETPASLGENPTWERQYESLLTLEGLQNLVNEQLDKVEQLREENKCRCADPFQEEDFKKPPSVPVKMPQKRSGLSVPQKSVSLKELVDLEALKLNVAMLHQRLEIQKAMEAELLPLLEPGSLQVGSRALLYRAIYTLLCEGGENFPVLVNDMELSN